ncbi:MAG: helix-turn-helix transcriptional regulator [Moraxella equi]|nr:helix-turn-helix transcriptional regulator [Moraxella equi]
MALHNTIRKLRELHQLTQEDMAERAMLSKNGYANIERGESIPNIDSLEKIAHAFGMKIEDLISFNHDDFNISVINGYVNHFSNGNIHHGDKELEAKIQLLEQQIKHEKILNNQKDEIILSLKEEIKLLKEMNELLKQHK